MAAKLPVWGIDIGQCSLKAVKLQSAGEGVELLDFDVMEHEQILSQAGAEAAGMVRAILEKFLSKHDVKGSRVVVAVPGQQTLTRFIKMPPVETKKIPDMVKYEAGQQIPFDMDEVVWDYQVFQETDSPDIEVGIFAIRRELIRNHLSQFTELGIEPVVAQAGPMAAYNAIKYDQPPAEGESMVLLDMGALATDLIVMTGNTIWSRPVPIGGNRFTEALVSAFKISFKKAEELKRSAQSSKYARQIFQAMRPVFADLVSEIQRSIGSYTASHREAHITRALGMGNAFKLPGLQKFLQQNLSIEFEKLSDFKKINAGAVGQSPEYTDNLMSLSMAYGLALQGLDLAAVDSNLLPPEVRKALLWKKKRVWFGAAAACLLGAAGAIWTKNSMALGALSSGMGSQTTNQLPSVPLTQADAVINQGQGSMTPVEYAAKVAAAAGVLKAEFGKLGSGADARQTLLNEVAKLPNNNIILPRIVQFLQKSVNTSIGEPFRDVASVNDYIATVLDANRKPKTPRTDRDEIWVETIQMAYNNIDAERGFLDLGQGETTPVPGQPPSVNKAGWAVLIQGVTTRSNSARWIEDTLIKSLDVQGKQPGRGFYIDKVTLAKAQDRPQSISSTAGDTIVASPSSPALTPRGGFMPGGRDERGGRIGGAGPFNPIPAPGQPGRVKSIIEEIAEIEYKIPTDPITGEPTKSDTQFIIRLLVFPTDTPADKIPDVFKPKDPKAGDAPKRDAKPPAPAPRRE